MFALKLEIDFLSNICGHYGRKIEKVSLSIKKCKKYFYTLEVYLLILNKLKQIFKGRNDDENKNIAEDMIKENKEGMNENIVYPEDVGTESTETFETDENTGTENIDPDAAFVPNLDLSERELQDEEFNLLNAKDDIDSDVPKSEKEIEEVSADYDQEIERLMAQDAATEIGDVDYDYINDISVYDTLRKEKEETLKEINDEINGVEQDEEKDTSLNLLYVALIGILGVMLIAVIMFIIIIPSGGNKKEEKKDPKVIDVSSYKSNNANYIYLSQKGIIDKKEIELSKILVDSKATLFYFNGKFDIQKYNIILSDNNQNTYSMDLSFIQNRQQDSEEEKNETILHFEPLDRNVKSINLSLYNSSTGSRLDFPFNFDGPIEETPVKYVFDEEAKSNNQDVKVNIDNAIFSSAGSVINYTIQSSGKDFSIIQDDDNNKDSISLEENATNVKKIKKYPTIFSFDNGNTILGRMDFRSTESLESKIYLTFKNLYKSYTVNRDFSADTINKAGEKDPISFDVGNYKIVLERVVPFNDRIVFVLHGEDKNIKYDANNPNANRVEVRLDVEAISTSASGVEVILDGVIKSAEYGTDVSFMINESNRSLIYSLGAGNLKVRINSVLIKTDDAKAEFNLKKAKTEDDKDRSKACGDVIDAFKGRLAYKSGEKSIESIIGFSDVLIKEGSILSEYSPENLTEKAQYSAQIISSALKGDKFYATVQEVWKGIKGIKEFQFDGTHKIVAQKGEYFWTITEDIVMK